MLYKNEVAAHSDVGMATIRFLTALKQRTHNRRLELVCSERISIVVGVYFAVIQILELDCESAIRSLTKDFDLIYDSDDYWSVFKYVHPTSNMNGIIKQCLSEGMGNSLTLQDLISKVRANGNKQ